ncbi:MAG: Tm-1-like ATP-binding domain-containing protein, partial [Anaerolineae bacterium]
PGQAFYDPEADAALVDALEAGLAPGTEVTRVEAHVNDAAFASALAVKMRALLEA